jgi:hypothetical protein
LTRSAFGKLGERRRRITLHLNLLPPQLAYTSDNSWTALSISGDTARSLQLPPPPQYQYTSGQPRQRTAWVWRLSIQGLWVTNTVQYLCYPHAKLLERPPFTVKCQRQFISCALHPSSACNHSCCTTDVISSPGCSTFTSLQVAADRLSGNISANPRGA